jgi:hypothetical protein
MICCTSERTCWSRYRSSCSHQIGGPSISAKPAPSQPSPPYCNSVGRNVPACYLDRGGNHLAAIGRRVRVGAVLLQR